MFIFKLIYIVLCEKLKIRIFSVLKISENRTIFFISISFQHKRMNLKREEINEPEFCLFHIRRSISDAIEYLLSHIV